MLHITEDTPADMLAGAMDLTIHLPTGKTSKMCVERSTPMMDLLVQITTNHQLQITNYTLQPLQTAPNSGYSDKVLSYYPNTPIGALDTQHVRVVPKTRTLPVQKNIPPGHQPFESTFRMKVHLPRNQLYVTRVSRHVHIEDIMRKVCEEKNLDPNKCEVRHPGNLDEVLDPKLTLNDYMITEIYLILKGTNSLNQAFSSNDIMALRKEEERKQMHTKTGGGVFNLIFRRGKSNTGSGSISTTENSISPTHSDDSRSTTPPVVSPPKRDVQAEKPKAPQRKRRPAPKPPQPPQPPTAVELRVSPAVSETSAGSDIISKNETNIMICHSRHSSDSSGYHETSILSDHCNTSLSRRNRLEEGGKSLNRHSESVGNLSKMTTQSRSTSSLAFPGRKKKAAPPPPKIPTKLEEPSPVVASQTAKTDSPLASPGIQTTNPPPAPRKRKGPVPLPRPRSALITAHNYPNNEQNFESFHSCPYHEDEEVTRSAETSRPPSTISMSTTEILKSLEYLNLDDQGRQIRPPEVIAVLPKTQQEIEEKKKSLKLDLVDKEIDEDNSSITTISPYRDELTSLESEVSAYNVRVLKKDFSITSLRSSESVLFEEGVMRRWGSFEKLDVPPTPPSTSPPVEEEVVEISPFERVILENWGDTTDGEKVEIEEDDPRISVGRSFGVCRNSWVVGGDQSDAESHTSCGFQTDRSKLESEEDTKDEKQSQVMVEEEKQESLETPYSPQETNEMLMNDLQRYISYDKSPQDSGNSSDISEKSKLDEEILDEEKAEEETEWQLPSPPKAFKDTPTCPKEEAEPVISPELLEKLKQIEEQQDCVNSSDNSSTISEDRPILSKLTLENLEKRKSLVYNRELATSLKLYDSTKYQSNIDLSKTYNQFEETLEEIRKVDEQNRRNRAAETNNRSTLPNFKITTYDEPKQKIKVFEDDTIRSNSESAKKAVTLGRTQSLQKIPVENVAMRQEVFKRPRDVEHRKFRPKSEYLRGSVNRSESFSVENNDWSPSKPVARSKSQIGLKREEGGGSSWKPGTMSKSSSLYDVSGLQSLEVMRKIQDKLNTPTNSMETLDRVGSEKTEEPKPEREETRKFQYSGPPSINMSTWSERPKIPVSVKEDSDYKLGQRLSNYGLNSRVEIRHSPTKIPEKTENQNVTIKINGSESISSQRNGNVVIKIGEKDSHKFTTTQRPHSVAFPADFDISRVPIVRSVELKKNFKETPTNNTTVTHLNQSNENGITRPVFRAKSFLQPSPVVKGFRDLSQNEGNASKIRHSWQATPVAKQENFTTNQNVPFSKFNLRRTESKKILEDAVDSIPKIVKAPMPPPPPPQMPKIVEKKITKRQFVPVVDPREELLKSIRDFGGKRGLRSTKS